MLKKTVTYTDWNGVTCTDDFYFNLTQVECAELEYGLTDSSPLSESIQGLIEAGDMKTVIALVKKLLLTAYGIKSPDGKRFVKNDEVREAFEQHPAFEQIYMELATNSDYAADFVIGVLPSKFVSQMGSDPKQKLFTEAKKFGPLSEV